MCAERILQELYGGEGHVLGEEEAWEIGVFGGGIRRTHSVSNAPLSEAPVGFNLRRVSKLLPGKGAAILDGHRDELAHSVPVLRDELGCARAPCRPLFGPRTCELRWFRLQFERPPHCDALCDEASKGVAEEVLGGLAEANSRRKLAQQLDRAASAALRSRERLGRLERRCGGEALFDAKASSIELRREESGGESCALVDEALAHQTTQRRRAPLRT